MWFVVLGKDFIFFFYFDIWFVFNFYVDLCCILKCFEFGFCRICWGGLKDWVCDVWFVFVIWSIVFVVEFNWVIEWFGFCCCFVGGIGIEIVDEWSDVGSFY